MSRGIASTDLASVGGAQIDIYGLRNLSAPAALGRSVSPCGQTSNPPSNQDPTEPRLQISLEARGCSRLEPTRSPYQDCSRKVLLSSSEGGNYDLRKDEEVPLRFASTMTGVRGSEGRSSSEKPTTCRRKPLEEKRLSKRAYPFLEHFAILRVLGSSSVSLTSAYRNR